MSGLQHSHLAIPLLGPNPERSLRAWRIGPFPLLIMLIVFVSSFSGGQELKRQDEAEVREESVPLGQQLPTANALRAPIKAQRAVERATAAMARNQPREAQKQLAYALDLYPEDRKSTRLNSSHVEISYAVFCHHPHLHSFPTRRSSDLLKRQDEAEVREESVPLGQQLPTANALRAPIKAQRAVERATAAMARNQPREAQKQLAYALDLYP